MSERKEIQLKIFYTWENAKHGFFDKKFKQEIKWDIPLLEGYDFEFVKNTSTDQGTHHRKGIINPSLNSVVANWKPSAVLIFGWNFHSHFNAMRHFKGKIPVFFRGDSTLLDKRSGIKALLRRIALKFVYNYIDFAFYVGTNSKNYYLKHGIKEKQLIYGPHTVDNERFCDKTGELEKLAQDWKKDLKIEKNDVVFLFAGKFEPKKDPILLLEAIKYLKDKKFKFIFAGDGVLKKQLETYVKQNRNIILLPFQNQSKMPVLYRLADVFVLPSKGPNETWGLAINEAMACNKAVLVSDRVGCAIDLVENGKNGYIFEAGKLKDIEQKLAKFDTNNISEFGNYSFNKIQNFSITKLASIIEQAINTI